MHRRSELVSTPSWCKKPWKVTDFSINSSISSAENLGSSLGGGSLLWRRPAELAVDLHVLPVALERTGDLDGVLGRRLPLPEVCLVSFGIVYVFGQAQVTDLVTLVTKPCTASCMVGVSQRTGCNSLHTSLQSPPHSDCKHQNLQVDHDPPALPRSMPP